MAKLTVEYARTVRIKQYESLRLGMSAEGDNNSEAPWELFDYIKAETEKAIAKALADLKK